MATLTKSGSSFALGDLRGYDAWGNVLGTNATGRPRGRYVASLGHVQDDESSLIYMRARYYEPTSGRFVSEDPAKHGSNWFSYCGNDPVNLVDRSGEVAENLLFSGLANWEAGLALSTMARFLGPFFVMIVCSLAAVGSRMNGSLPTAGLLAANSMSAGWIALAGAPINPGLKENVQGFYQAYAGFLEIAMYVILNDWI